MDQRPHVGWALPPTRSVAIMRWIGTPIWLRVGVAGSLVVAGRRTGRSQKVSLVPVEVDGSWYILGFGGATDWVRNLRAAGRGELRHKGRTQAIAAVEVDGPMRDRVIATYLSKLPGGIQKDFNRKPDAADHPTFRLDPIT